MPDHKTASTQENLLASKHGPEWSAWWGATHRPALRLTVGNLKGGAGKTTTAVQIALAAALGSGEPTLLVDADPQNDAWTWGQMAGDKWPRNLIVERWDEADKLGRRLRDEGDGYAHVVVDTGPSDPEILRTALHLTRRLLVPLAPTVIEVQRLMPTLRAVREVAAVRDDLGLSILLTRTKGQANARLEVRRALAGRDLPVMPQEVPNLEAWGRAFGEVPKRPAELGAYRPVIDTLAKEDR